MLVLVAGSSGVRRGVGAIGALDDQKRGSRSSTVHRRVEQGEQCSIGVGEPWPADLALENEELVAEGEDLGVARVAGSEYPPETGEYKAHESRKADQERKTLPASTAPETRAITGRMSIRHAQAWPVAAQTIFGMVTLIDAGTIDYSIPGGEVIAIYEASDEDPPGCD